MRRNITKTGNAVAVPKKAVKQQVIPLTASKSHSRKVWTSYGIAMCLLPFLGPK